MSGGVLYLELPIAHEWTSIEPLRERVLRRLAPVAVEPGQARLLAMVVAELLENAVKYGDWSESDGRAGLATLRVVSDARALTVTVANPVRRDDPGLGRLRAILRSLASSPPGELYAARLQELAAHPGAAAGGLGLMRVAAEAGCRLAADVGADAVLRVTALIPL